MFLQYNNDYNYIDYDNGKYNINKSDIYIYISCN